MLNKLLLIGNLGADPEQRVTPAGKAVCSFNVAVNRAYRNSEGENVKETMWVRVTAWEKLGELCNAYLKKGGKVCVLGELAAEPYVDANNKGHYQMTAREIEFLDGKQQQEDVGF